MSDWKPIETAPKDGTAVLLLCPGDRQCVASYGMNWPFNETWRIYIPCMGQSGHSSDAVLHHDEDMPTHWMPLPDPPSAVISREDYLCRIGNVLGLDPDDMHSPILDDLQWKSVDQPEKCRRKSRHE
jgi:hypothetical protein